MNARIQKSVSRFIRDTKGDASLEAIIILPALLVIFAISWLYFDVMRQQSINQKANYTIGDIISRETEILDEAYIDNARNLLFHLAQAQGDDVDLRVSVVQFVETGATGQGVYQLVWSTAVGDWSAHVPGGMSDYLARLPIMAGGDQVVLVETRDWYQPLVQLANDGFDIKTYSFTRPRFAPQVIFAGVNDGTGRTWQNEGWGNGDDDAPSGVIEVGPSHNESNDDDDDDNA